MLGVVADCHRRYLRGHAVGSRARLRGRQPMMIGNRDSGPGQERDFENCDLRRGYD